MFGRTLSTPIRKRVLATVEQRIAAGQAEFDSGCEVIEDAYMETIRAASEARTTGKTALEDKIVNNIVGKLL